MKNNIINSGRHAPSCLFNQEERPLQFRQRDRLAWRRVECVRITEYHEVGWHWLLPVFRPICLLIAKNVIVHLSTILCPTLKPRRSSLEIASFCKIMGTKFDLEFPPIFKSFCPTAYFDQFALLVVKIRNHFHVKEVENTVNIRHFVWLTWKERSLERVVSRSRPR